jgi:TolA-binding protein
MRAVLLALSIMLSAPYQCATEPNERPKEDSAPKALWMLAERFEAEGQANARESTLKQLVEQYPSSRYADRAREALGMPAQSRESGGDSSDDESKSED